MSEIRAEVLVRGKPRFNMVGQKMPDTLYDSDQIIRPGTVKRLYAYALGRLLDDAGFDVATWPCEVSTMDGDLPVSERVYCVEFSNSKGGKLGVQGILMHHGWPALDHGLCIDEGRTASPAPKGET